MFAIIDQSLYIVSQGVAAACREFLARRDPKDAASFAALTRLPITNSLECNTLLDTIMKACASNVRNCFAAGPPVVRRVCELACDGLVMGVDSAERWILAVKGLVIDDDVTTPAVAGVNMRAFASAGGVGVLLRAADRYLASESHSVLVVKALGLLALHSSRMQGELLRSGCLARLYAMTATHLQHGQLQGLGASVMYRLSTPKEDADPWPESPCKSVLGIAMDGKAPELIVVSGGLSRLYAAMDAHGKKGTVVACLCSGLMLLATPANAARLFTTGAVERMNGVMGAYPDDTTIQHTCMRVVAGVACGDERRAAAIVASGSLHLMYTAMAAHPTSAIVQSSGVLALCMLSSFPANVPAMKAGRAAALTRAALALHGASPEIASNGRMVLLHLGSL